MAYLVGLALTVSAAALVAQGDGSVSIATVDGMGFPVEHAINVLRQGGIQAGAGGSLVYGVFVDKKVRARAIKVLRNDAKTHPYDYLSIAGHKGKLGPSEESTWPLRKFDVDLDKVDSDPEFKKDANLRGMARESVLQMADMFPKVKKVTYFIKEMSFLTMEYMDSKGHLQQGYYGVVTIGYRGSSGSARFWMYSWNQGRDHSCRGGNATEPPAAGMPQALGRHCSEVVVR